MVGVILRRGGCRHAGQCLKIARDPRPAHDLEAGWLRSRGRLPQDRVRPKPGGLSGPPAGVSRATGGREPGHGPGRASDECTTQRRGPGNRRGRLIVARRADDTGRADRLASGGPNAGAGRRAAAGCRLSRATSAQDGMGCGVSTMVFPRLPGQRVPLGRARPNSSVGRASPW